MLETTELCIDCALWMNDKAYCIFLISKISNEILGVCKTDPRWFHVCMYKCVVPMITYCKEAPDELNVFADCMHLKSTTGTKSIQEISSVILCMINFWPSQLIPTVCLIRQCDIRCPFSYLSSGTPVECYASDHRLANMSSYDDASGTSYYIGTLEVCVHGTYYPVCLDYLSENTCSYFYYDNAGKL